MAGPKCWSRSVGSERGGRARVYERQPGSVLYVSVWRPGEGERRVSLGHRDKRRAVQEAEAMLALRTEVGQTDQRPPLTLETLFARYVAEGRYLPDGSLKTDAYLKHVEMAGRYLAAFFGADCPVERLTPDKINEYVVWRRNGGPAGRPVRTTAAQRDLVMFKAALNWACQKYDADTPLLTRHVMQGRKIPKEKDPKRPSVTEETIEKLLKVAQELRSFLPALIMLSWKGGHRLTSNLSLRWDDVDFEHGTIRFRSEHDKVGQTWEVPAHPSTMRALKKLRAQQPAIGTSLVFPHPRQDRHPGNPMTRHVAAYWLNRAYREAKLTKQAGTLWHAFRRVWATERKFLPPEDVAAVGGWRDINTLRMYQQVDEETMREVAEYERPRSRNRRVARR